MNNKQFRQTSTYTFKKSKTELIKHQYRICQPNDLGFIKPYEDNLRIVKGQPHVAQLCWMEISPLWKSWEWYTLLTTTYMNVVDILIMVNSYR